MNELVLHCAIEKSDFLTMDGCGDDLEVVIECRHEQALAVYLSKDSAQQLADYLTAWLGEAK